MVVEAMKFQVECEEALPAEAHSLVKYSGSHFQTPEYVALAHAYGQSPRVLVASSEGQVVGYWIVVTTPTDYAQEVPQSRIRSWSSRRLMALSGPVLDPAQEANIRLAAALTRSLVRLSGRTGWRLRGRLYPTSGSGSMVRALSASRSVRLTVGHSYILRVPDTVTSLHAGFRPDRRRNVRRARDLGISVRIAECELDIKDYVSVRNEALDAQGFPRIAMDHVLSSYRVLGPAGMFRCFLAYDGQQAVAGQLVFSWNGYTYLAGVCISPDARSRKLPANDLLQSSVLEWAIAHEQHTVDFVGAQPTSLDAKINAIDSAKRSWGATMVAQPNFLAARDDLADSLLSRVRRTWS